MGVSWIDSTRNYTYNTIVANLQKDFFTIPMKSVKKIFS